jgi:hypothetical protein
MYFLGQMEPRWRITAYYLIALWAFIVVAKVVSLLLSEGSLKDRLTFLGIAPTLSIKTWNAARAARWTDFGWSIGWAAAVFPATVAVYFWFPAMVSRWSLPWAAQAYLCIVPLWLLTEAVGLATRLVFLPAGILIPSIHDEPWRSCSLAEFWGRRWNRLFGDWFRQAIFQPLHGRPYLATCLAFAVSGVLHEWVVNLPLWAVFGKNLFGSMCLYFLLQAGGIVVERRWIRHYPGWKRLFLWGVVIVPVPLVLNEGTLRIFQWSG